jgi:type III pantothenate kinase
MHSILVISVGTSRMTWALVGQRRFRAQGAALNAEIGTLALRDWQNLPRPARAVGVNAAGEAARVRVEGQLARWRLHMEWLVPAESAGGIINLHRPPMQLGPHRWAALVAAHRRNVAAGAPPSPCVVVNAGTLVTVDALDGAGIFRGGIILPGLRLMLHAVAETSGAYKIAPGYFDDFPTTTADALASGAVQAVCGAVEQVRAQLRMIDADVTCYLTGVMAPEIAPYLTGPLEVVDNLVLEGVLVLAAESDPTIAA